MIEITGCEMIGSIHMEIFNGNKVGDGVTEKISFVQNVTVWKT